MDQSNHKPESFRVDLNSGGSQAFVFGVAATQGRRPGMEDAHIVSLDVDGSGATSLFAVFDGHAGGEAAAFCARHVVRVLRSTPAYGSGDLEGALSQAFLRLDAMLMDPVHRQELACLHAGLKPGRDQAANAALAETYGALADDGSYRGAKAGCTACVAVCQGEFVYVASVGDSRCVVCEAGGTPVSLTRDHKPELGGEAERVIKAGFSIASNRVHGQRTSLAMSRALGDAKYKDPSLQPHEQGVSPVPDTAQYAVGSGPAAISELGQASPDPAEPRGSDAAEFMILACDGLWDSMTNDQAVAFVRRELQAGSTPQQVALSAVKKCLTGGPGMPASTDNITVMVVAFEAAPHVDLLGAA